MTPCHVVVVGAGFAGLAAAVRLARGGARVTVLERRPFLGGRAYSFADPGTGEVVDNGPHALMGAYTEALDFLAEIGAREKLEVQPRLHVTLADPALGMGAVAAPPVPGPLQAPAALLRYRLLAPGDRIRLLAGALRLAGRGAELRDRTVAEALRDAGQSSAACARFWHPLAIATLNEAPELAAAAPFAAVLRRAFFAGARAARFALARVPLSDLYTTDARRAVEEAGGTVTSGAAVASLSLAGERVAGVVLKDGRRVAEPRVGDEVRGRELEVVLRDHDAVAARVRHRRGIRRRPTGCQPIAARRARDAPRPVPTAPRPRSSLEGRSAPSPRRGRGSRAGSRRWAGRRRRPA